MLSVEFQLNRLLRRILWLSVCLFTIFAGVSASHGEDADLKILHDRMLEMSLQGEIDIEAVKGFMASLQPDGSWTDFAYEDQALTNWQPNTHICRLLDMVRAYRRADSPLKGDEKLRSSIYAAFDFWIQKNPICRNWWLNQIGVPQRMLQILFMMEHEFSPERMNAGLNILDRASIRATGQNLVWLAQITAARACLIGDSELAARAFKAIADEIHITRKEGIQPDMSFHQHGPQLYNGGYGLGFGNDCARIAMQVCGTRFAFPKEKIDILSHYILDGQQWMFRGIEMDNSVHGRGISRRDLSAEAMIAGCDNMAKLGTPDRAKFLAFARTLKGELPPAATLAGNKHFWCSDYMMHRRPAYNASVRMASKRLKRTEVTNKENLKGDHLSDGVTYTYLRGDEYKNIFPLWDWRKLPGTTCLQGERPFHPGGNGKHGYAGGVSDGAYGLAAFHLANERLVAKKAYFYFDTEYLCLGTGITCEDENEVVTSVNQCWLRGDVIARDVGGMKTIPKGIRSFDAIQWIHHDNVGYVFRGNSSVHLANETRKASWKDINYFQKPNVVSGGVFCLWIDHGRTPAKQTYEYLVIPGITAAGMDRYVAQSRSQIEVIQNNSEQQAVRHAGLGITQIAFYAAGVVRKKPIHIGSDVPCLVMLREMGNNVRVAVSNPKNEPLEVNLEIGRKLTGEGCEWDAAKRVTRVHLSLPNGDLAGSSMVRDLTNP